MSKRELWEIVRADELKVGDVFKPGINFPPTVVEKIEEGGWIKTEIYPVASNDTVFRRIPDAEDPRVLMRALAIAELHDPSPFGTVKQWIDQARRELESEGIA